MGRDNQRPRGSRGGARGQFEARRMRFPGRVAAAVWLRPDRQPIQERFTRIEELQLFVMRQASYNGSGLHGLAIYQPAFREADGMLLVGPGQCRGLYDLRARAGSPGAIDAARDRFLVRASLLCLDAFDAYVAAAWEIRPAPPLPEIYFGFAEAPIPEISPRLVREAAAFFRLRQGVEPTLDQLGEMFDRMVERAGRETRNGLIYLPSALFVRSRTTVYETHPFDGSTAPDGDPRTDGVVEGGWYARDGRWIPLAQRPTEVVFANEMLVGRVVDRLNPAVPQLQREVVLGEGPEAVTLPPLIGPGEQPARWGAARLAQFQAALDAPERAEWVHRLTRPMRPDTPRREASVLLANLPNPEFFTEEDLRAMLRNPGAAPEASGASRAVIFPNQLEALSYTGADAEVDLSISSQMYRQVRPAAYRSPTLAV